MPNASTNRPSRGAAIASTVPIAKSAAESNAMDLMKERRFMTGEYLGQAAATPYCYEAVGRRLREKKTRLCPKLLERRYYLLKQNSEAFGCPLFIPAGERYWPPS